MSKRQTVICTAVNPMHKEHKDPYEIDLNAPRLAWYTRKWKRHEDTEYWVDIQLAQQKGDSPRQEPHTHARQLK